MRDLGVDFQPSRPRLLPVVLLFTACVLCVDAWIELLDHETELTELQAQMTKAQRRAERLTLLSGPQSPGKQPPIPVDQAKALQLATAAIGIDWEALFRQIDHATQEDVALLAITPNATGKSLQISGEARNLKAVLGFVKALNQQPLSQASLLSHKVKVDDPPKPNIFENTPTRSPST